jgi:hypothetical protein
VTGFSLPSVAIPAALLQTSGGKREGEIFTMQRVPQHAGPETALDLLNRPDAFFPFRPKKDGAGGGVLLVAKARTVMVSVPRTEPPPEDSDRLSAAKQASLEVTLADGSKLSGWATLELPEYHSRLLDYLNASRDEFFELATADHMHIVNRAHVLYVRPED